jgi:putative hydrolase of the HAD superfamily
VHKAYRTALGKVFLEYLPRRYYLHRDLFKDALLEMLEKLGVKAKPDAFDWYRNRQWFLHKRDFQLRQGVLETLASLKEQQLHLGIVSNIDEDQLDHLLEISKIEPFFDSILSSEKTGSCKPDPEIFNRALEQAACRPEEVLFVGDTPLQDIAGANQVGMTSVLIWNREDQNPPETAPLVPNHVIREIPDLLDLL